MTRKTHISVLCTMFVLTNTCLGYVYDTEPQLVSSDYRLAAMGNLDLVVEHWDNEINAYDFGKSPAGILEDDSGKSTVYVPVTYGFTNFDDSVYSEIYAWDGYKLSGSSVVRIQQRFAIGGFASKKRTESVDNYTPYWRRTKFYDTYDGKIIAAYSLSSWPTLGFGFNYTKRQEIDEYEEGESYDSLESDRYEYEPSLLLQPPKLPLWFALTYRLSKTRDTPAVHDVIFPVIFSSGQYTVGLRAELGTIPNDGPTRQSLAMRSLFRFSVGDRYVYAGSMLEINSPLIMSFDDYSSLHFDGRQMDLGIGLAYGQNGVGLIGIEYERNIRKLEFVDGDFFTVHTHNVNLGVEINVIRILPLRFGYVNSTLDYPGYYYSNPTEDVVTAGCGLYLSAARLWLDFAYNVKILDTPFHYEREKDKDHLFGLSGRFFW